MGFACLLMHPRAQPCTCMVHAPAPHVTVCATLHACSLVITAARVLGVTVEYALEAFGTYFVHYVSDQVGAVPQAHMPERHCASGSGQLTGSVV